MKFTYYDQTVDLFSEEYFPNGPPNKVVINLSGGLDSAALLFLLCTYFPDVKKHIFTGDNANHPFEFVRAKNIVKFIMTTMPNHNIKSHDILPYNSKDPAVLDEVKQLVSNDPNYYYSRFPLESFSDQHDTDQISFYRKIAKPLINERNVNFIKEKYNCSRNLAAMTQNPPNKEMERLQFANLAETKRNEDCNNVHVFNIDGGNYHPFARVNKLFVKGIYEKHDLMESLFRLTSSCVGGADITEYYTKPCEKCFWCHEKKWAFGKF